MKPDFDKMADVQMRDWLAEDLGWRCVADDGNIQRTSWINERYAGCPVSGGTIIVTKDGEDIHPVAWTLDFADAAMPEGWEWGRGFGVPKLGITQSRWVGWNESGKGSYAECEVPNTGNKVRDLFCLACKCRWAEKEAQ